jgi:hypothetical protein
MIKLFFFLFSIINMNIKLEHVLLLLLFVCFLKMIRDKCCCRLTEGYFGETQLYHVGQFAKKHPTVGPLAVAGTAVGAGAACALGGCEALGLGAAADGVFMVGEDIVGGGGIRSAFTLIGSE